MQKLLLLPFVALLCFSSASAQTIPLYFDAVKFPPGQVDNVGANNLWDTTSDNWVDSSGALVNVLFSSTANTVIFGKAGGGTGSMSISVNHTVNVADMTIGKVAGLSYTFTGNRISSSSGTLLIDSDSATTTTFNNSTGGANQFRNLTLNEGSLAGSSSSSISVSNSISLNNGASSTIGVALAGAGALTKTGAGTTTLTAANAYSGNTNVSGGTLKIGSGGTSGSIASSSVALSSGTSLTFNRSDNLTYSGAISGSGSLTQNGVTSGKLTLTGNNTYTGNTNVVAGTLEIGNGGTSGSLSSATVNVSTGASLVFNRSDASAFSGAITGQGGVQKNGAGTLTLSGSLTGFNGVLNVNGGSLVANSAISNATINVASGATLDGSGTFGNVSLGANSTLTGTGTYNNALSLDQVVVSPGNSPGTLTINNSLTSTANTVFNFELNGANQTVGGGVNDLITGVTNLTLAGTINISNWLNPFASTGTWRLFNYSGTFTNNGVALGITPSLPGFAYNLDTLTTGQINLVITSVPEPTSLALVLFGCAGLLCRRKRSV